MAEQLESATQLSDETARALKGHFSEQPISRPRVSKLSSHQAKKQHKDGVVYG